MKLIILFITIILSSKSFSEPINDINFVDGKYFAYIDDNSLRWEIIIIKENNELKIEFLDVKRVNLIMKDYKFLFQKQNLLINYLVKK